MGGASSTFAAFVEYSDRSLWEDAVGVLSQATWDNYIIPPGGLFFGSNGIDGVDGEMLFTNPGTGQAPVIFDNNWDGGAGSIGLGTGNVIASQQGVDVSWTGAVNGLGFDLRGYGAGIATSSFDIVLGAGGELFTTTVNNPTGGFWGIVDTTGTISSVSVNVATGGSVTVMDTFTLARVSVPAPGGLVLVLGLAGLVLTRRVKRK